jgi:hypothetical protein
MFLNELTFLYMNLQVSQTLKQESEED